MTSATSKAAVNRYYRLHTPMYDATRWMFLFGRRRLVRRINAEVGISNPAVTEVGCGTGYLLRQFRLMRPDALLQGIEPSEAMLKRARRKLRDSPRTNLHYGTLMEWQHRLAASDVILFSYSLTMMAAPENVRRNLQMACRLLRPGGLLGIVDFYDTPFRWFERWMRLNHVHIEYNSTPYLRQLPLTSLCSDIRNAYLGWWKYRVYIGVK